MNTCDERSPLVLARPRLSCEDVAFLFEYGKTHWVSADVIKSYQRLKADYMTSTHS
jgi:hypothetical protein